MPKKPTAQSGGAAGKASGKSTEKKQNPVIRAARVRYAKKLRGEGVAKEQIQEKARAYVASTARPALKEAKAAAASKNLTGPERKKFIEDAVRTKLGSRA